MPSKGYTWDQEYREKYYSSEKVQEHLERFRVSVSKPKTEEQKAKMRAAKLGRPKSEEHRQAMSLAHQRRQELKREIQRNSPDLSEHEVWELVRQQTL